MTPDIRVIVRPMYAESASQPGREVFVYFVRIENHADETFKLLEREWTVTDGDGTVTEVRGEGVVGEQPVLAPGAVFTYNSFTHVRRTPGSMVGAYVMQDAWGERHRVPIPAFALVTDEARDRPLN